MIVDSSVWIDYFNGVVNPATDRLDQQLGIGLIGVGDLILTEVLRGFRHDSEYQTAKNLMLRLTVVDMLGQDIAIQAAEHFRYLRKKGITIRKLNDIIIATYCIAYQQPLLFSDRDFLPFCQHLGLKSAL